MNQKFDSLLKTLTNIRQARQTPDVEEEQRAIESDQATTTTAVPSERTTLKLSKKRGTAEATAVDTPPPTVPPPPPPTTKLRPTAAARPAADERPTPAAHHADHTVVPPPPPPPESPITPTNEPEHYPAETDSIPIDYFEPEPPPPPHNEMAAALHAKAATRHKKPKQTPLPNDMVQTAFRLEKGLKDAFEQTCRDRATNPSTVIRILIKQYCGLYYHDINTFAKQEIK